jgi:hypothetical protein
MIYKRDYQEETQHQLRQLSHGRLPMDFGVLVAVGTCPLNPSVIPLSISLDECLSPSPPPHHHYPAFKFPP